MSEQKPKIVMPPRKIGVREFRGNMTGVLREVRQGMSFQITSNDVVVAELRPPPVQARRRRQPGALRGMMWMAPDWDAWPDGLLDEMQGISGDDG